ncbi:recombinase family protein [Pseudomonas capeferrum]|uniref:recombinase family protein n=1 Tax=Pseudomonas capeferrum TaxID=1495066 RepID=UPI0004D78533|nr:recombinase family protein [Pseudomonas capeferrum]KEY84862.1 resolvase [Pseudomonas capeferrum]MCH7302312.1 recombinase family protein [Pseudomonas capeferrum]
MSTIAYLRVSTDDQSTEAQRHAIEQLHNIEHWYVDEATSGTTKALQREGFGELFKFVRKGDTVVIFAIDRLGRDTIDVLETVKALKGKGVAIISVREGFDLSNDYGTVILSVLASLAELERSNIKARQLAGIARARATGRKLGAPKKIDDHAVSAWRTANSATIQETATQFGISIATVKRACASNASVNEQGE